MSVVLNFNYVMLMRISAEANRASATSTPGGQQQWQVPGSDAANSRKCTEKELTICPVSTNVVEEKHATIVAVA